MKSLAFYQLFVIGVVVAGSFDILARAATSSTQVSNSSATATALTTSASNATLASSSLSGTSLNSTNATATSSQSSSSSSSSSSTSTISTPTAAPTTDAQAVDAVKACHREDSKMDPHNSSPFCFPVNNAKIYAGNTTYFVWDPNQFGNDSTNEILLQYVLGQDSISNTTADNKEGWVKIDMKQEWLKGNTSTNLTVFLSSTDKPNPESGPMFTLVDPNSADDDHPSSKTSKKLGVGLGVPFALALIVLGILGICFFRRRRSRAGSYLNKRSLSKNNGRNQGIQSEDADWIGGTRGPERFRDEPGPGLELQDRSRGHNRGDSIVSSTSSNARDGFESQGGNVFREEISRQRDRNR